MRNRILARTYVKSSRNLHAWSERRGEKQRTKKRKRFLPNIQFSGDHRVSTSALICRSCNVKHPIFAGCVSGACFYSVAKNIAPDKNKKRQTDGANGYWRRSDTTVYTTKFCCLLCKLRARCEREPSGGESDREIGKKKKKYVRITRQQWFVQICIVSVSTFSS